MSRKAPTVRRTRIKAAHEVVEDALRHASSRAAKGPTDKQAAHAAVARKLGVSTSLLYKWREPAVGGSGQTNPLERAVQLIEATGDVRIADWICQRAGGSFAIENPATDPDLRRAANTLVRDFGLLIAEVVQATEDQVIDAEESRRLRARWDEIRARCEGFVRTCERDGYTKQS